MSRNEGNSLELLRNRSTAESSQLVRMIMKSNSPFSQWIVWSMQGKTDTKVEMARKKKMNWDQKIYSNGKFENENKKILAHNFKLKQTFAFTITSKSLSTDSATNHNLVVIFLLTFISLSLCLFEFRIPNRNKLQSHRLHVAG